MLQRIKSEIAGAFGCVQAMVLVFLLRTVPFLGTDSNITAASRE
jgi:hypothetical protein